MSHTGKGKAPKVLQVLIYFLILFLVIWAQICPDLLQPRSTQFHQFGATRSGYGQKMAHLGPFSPFRGPMAPPMATSDP